ncbi:ABC transporter ATP-binding protein [Oharaeibacter diazotrophicus]|uniref:Amino acid/amide ABC transporter ATP-binding protein 2 (HAAT family) n=1 Tax=Oharaeibacter diazotrophicus TaxID=1920512 RepID=A0A4R6R7Y3_9HYPH|nr:ABC transporter ATP-binding protein [Oharaeibacter diazotrophicus]TDP82002.1 amino acid/amide ABC transporter ATP-binding protein 2 (HAAT family) [Oharaeibacter diazotrophicus]BBE73634.1 high-affinity branched-chain amino acid transport ATP-binding protein LivF [Pleomorphomonas sp. SM30]GLS75423.1 ABC transporter ATP-binding protein [Oharaeibacter diazotrophicus]
MSAAPILSTAGLVAGYDPGVPIVRGASIAVGRGEIVVVLGPNGAGKSTLIKAIAGLVPISAGSVVLAGRDVTRTPAHRMVHEGLAFVPQTENVFPRMSVDDNLRVAGAVFGRAGLAARVDAMYALFPDLARQRRLDAGRLSGGQRQMVAVARALMVGPSVLMLDEPSAGLSPKLVAEVFAKLVEIREGGVTILLVEQNAKAALAIGDRAYVLVEGRERHEGPAAALWDDPAVAELYLGVRPVGDGGAP